MRDSGAYETARYMQPMQNMGGTSQRGGANKAMYQSTARMGGVGPATARVNGKAAKNQFFVQKSTTVISKELG